MYESITYAELKSLPREQKAIAWKELKTLYATQKELAEKLGVSPAIVYNMVSRYAREDSPSVRKTGRLETGDIPERDRVRAKRRKIREKLERNTVAVESAPPESVGLTGDNSETDTFSIRIIKAITGEEAQFLLTGIGSTLLRDRNYSIELKIAEK